jgi:hypothetical protein
LECASLIADRYRTAMVEVASSIYPDLGTLTSVEVREVWPHEAHAFTPWLLANADVLGEVLGMDLELSAAEHPVGGFALDLIGTNTANEPVIIENQLSQTDHGHLGQLLTYAGGTDPVNVVWVATSFREEHRAALDWLNARTDEHTRFFGVEVSVVRIGDSLPAPLLRLVAQPNDWGKTVKASARAETTASTKNLAYQEFWARFLERVRAERPDWTRSRKGTAQNWQPLPAGRSGLIYNCVFTRSGLVSELYFEDRDPAVNQARFAAAQARQAELEAAYRKALSFEPLMGKKACRIADRRLGAIEQTEEWDEYIEWFIDAQTRLRKAIAAIGGVPSLAA